MTTCLVLKILSSIPLYGFFKELFNFIAVLTEYGGLDLGPVHTAAALLTPQGSFMSFSCSVHVQLDGCGQQLPNICAN